MELHGNTLKLTFFTLRITILSVTCILTGINQFSSVPSLGCVRLSATPWTAAGQASLCITNSRSLFKLMSIEWVMPSNHLILCYPLLLPPSIFSCIRVFSNEFFASSGQSIGASASASVLPMNVQGWFHLGRTGWISLQSKGFLRLVMEVKSDAIKSNIV